MPDIGISEKGVTMPRIRVNGVELYYEDTEAGDETIVFSHGLLMNLNMFDDQIAGLKERYRCVAYDHRGQGRSEVVNQPYTIETNYEDALAFINALALGPCHFVGLSMGGFVGMRLAARHPDLVKSLVLLDTSAEPEPKENLLNYNVLKLAARWLGPRFVVNPVMKVMFGETFLNDPAQAERREKWKKNISATSRIGAGLAAGAVLNRDGVVDELANITAPTLILVGDEDVATVPAKSQLIHERIPNSKFLTIPRAGHSATIEQPEAVTVAMTEFYRALP